MSHGIHFHVDAAHANACGRAHRTLLMNRRQNCYHAVGQANHAMEHSAALHRAAGEWPAGRAVIGTDVRAKGYKCGRTWPG